MPGTASVEDGVTWRCACRQGADTRASLMAMIEMIDITPAETPARVIVNSRTGTVVINSAVRLSPAAISHGSLTVRIEENPRVVQPAPFSRGQTAVEQDSTIETEQAGATRRHCSRRRLAGEDRRCAQPAGASARPILSPSSRRSSRPARSRRRWW
jgi:flagellar basal body P-ring protein FlgI